MKVSVEVILDQMKEAVEEVFSTMLDTVAELVERGDCNHSNSNSENTVSGKEQTPVAIEAVVDFAGDPAGSVILRATAQGAVDIARKLLMADDDEAIDLEEIQDALGECANMVTGALKTRVMDPEGQFDLSIPRIDTWICIEHEHPAGSLVFELASGPFAVEIWLSEDTK